MSSYIENPKTKGSGIVCCIPQKGECPNKCADCFFQSGRSYLEPLDEHTPNMPTDMVAAGRVVRVNDGNDSAHERATVLRETRVYKDRFYNTACPDDLTGYWSLVWNTPLPVVLTGNAGEMTDHSFHQLGLEICPVNLMFVRMRTNLWNLDVVDKAVAYYTRHGVPVVLTFMAYHSKESIPTRFRGLYGERKRTLNTYWAIGFDAWLRVMRRYCSNPLVHSCGTEGVSGGTLCKNCGNCMREYRATMERIRTAT